ncbi:hypothetical protein BGZ70_002573, partial [Mortierella alpina]
MSNVCSRRPPPRAQEHHVVKEGLPPEQIFKITNSKKEDLDTFVIEAQLERTSRKYVVVWETLLGLRQDALYLQDSEGRVVDFLKDESDE